MATAKASLTLAKARAAARSVKAARKSKKSAKAVRGSKVWERFLGHFGPNETAKKPPKPSKKRSAARKRATRKRTASPKR